MNLNEDSLFNVEYADVLGIPFDFTAKPVVAPPQPPRETIQVKAVRPERDALEIRFPRVEGYRVELPEERLTAEFNEDSVLELTPDLVGATETRNSGIIGEARGSEPRPHWRRAAIAGGLRTDIAFGSAANIATLTVNRNFICLGNSSASRRQWLDEYLVCKGGTFPAQLKYKMLADMACNRITAGDQPRSSSASGRSRQCSTLITRLARPPRSLQHVEDRPLGDGLAPLPHQLGRVR